MNKPSHPLPCTIATLSLAALLVALAPHSRAADNPMWGHDASRNMVSPETGLPDSFDPGKFKSGTEEVDMATTKNIKWVAKLGSQAYGNVTIAKGKIFVGTNNESPRNPKYKGDYSMLMCFDEPTGAFKWQLAIPKLGAGKVSDWEYLGLCSSPTVDDDRVYVCTNRNEVVCTTTEGMAKGNTGPFKDEAKYSAGPDKPPIPTDETDGDIVWRFDMREELGVFPHNITSSAPLVVGDKVYANTSNGQDWSHLNIPSPNAPCLIVLDKATGKYVGEEASGISQRLMHGSWSSPSYGEVNGKGMIIFGAGDGFVYGFDPVPEKGDADVHPLKEIFKYDCNPPEHKKDKNGKPFKYPDPNGPCEIIASPVFYKNRVYACVGQDPEHGDGVGILNCIDATKTGDITGTGKVWSYDKIGRAISTVSITKDGLLFIAEYAGKVHCLDAETGKVNWVHDAQAHIWGSTLVADGKVYLGTEDGTFFVFAADKEKKVLSQENFGEPIYSTPVAANGVLYLQTPTHLYAIAKAAK
jgi:outer membrane protein assembly factor BamB